jgi:serine protease inhibitor
MDNKHFKNILLLITGLSLIFGVSTCSQPSTSRDIPHPPKTTDNNCTTTVKLPTIAPPTIDPKLITANTQFSFKLFSKILEKEHNKNIFVSPASVAIALTMTYNGAQGETQQAMAKTLELKDIDLKTLNQANAALITSLLKLDNPQIKIALANSLWAKQEISFQSEFLKNNTDFYGAQITNLDFNNPKSKDTINEWGKQQTCGKISQIIDKIDPLSVLYLINALYFKAPWQEQFKKDATKEQTFYLGDNGTKKVPMMSQKEWFPYYETLDFQAISLPYSGGRFSLYVFLPKKTSNLAKFSQQLTAENWDKWMNSFTRKEGTIKLPRVKLEYEISLNDTLKSLGMEIAFSDKANFSSMAKNTPNLFIGEVKHKTFVAVNEEGTEAAAVTSVGIRTTAMPPRENQPFEMIVDRAFFTAIRDNQTGTILFMGSIVEPK